MLLSLASLIAFTTLLLGRTILIILKNTKKIFVKFTVIRKEILRILCENKSGTTGFYISQKKWYNWIFRF